MRKEILEQKTIIENGLSGRCPKIKNCRHLRSFENSRVDVEDNVDNYSNCLHDYRSCDLNSKEGEE